MKLSKKALVALAAPTIAILLATMARADSVTTANMPASAAEAFLEEQLRRETLNLDKMQRDLEELRTAAPITQPTTPNATAPPATAPSGETNSPPQQATDANPAISGAVAAPPDEIQPAGHIAITAPLPGCEEELANCLYSAGCLVEAAEIYEKTFTSAQGEAKAWTALQLGHCRRRLGNNDGAMLAYSQAVSAQTGGPWSETASWWLTELKWRLLNNPAEKTAPAAVSEPRPEANNAQ